MKTSSEEDTVGALEKYEVISKGLCKMKRVVIFVKEHRFKEQAPPK
jgi:hypothetical protein